MPPRTCSTGHARSRAGLYFNHMIYILLLASDSMMYHDIFTIIFEFIVRMCYNVIFMILFLILCEFILEFRDNL